MIVNPIYFPVAAGICLLFAFSWAFRFKKQPGRAIAMGCGFVLLGFLSLGMGEKWPKPLMIALGVLLIFCLLADFAIQSANRQSAGQKK